MSEKDTTTMRRLNVERSTSTAHRLSHYDGVCGNIHGHNIKWEVEIGVTMEDVGEDNMPVDFKSISDAIDYVDHAILLKEDDELFQLLDIDAPVVPEGDSYKVKDNPLGEAIIFPGEDPTCEFLVRWMAKKIYGLHKNIEYVNLSASETDKYEMSYSYPT